MKKKVLCFITTLLVLISGLFLVGCDTMLGVFDDVDTNEIPQIDNSVDLEEYTPVSDDDNQYIQDETYYTSQSVDLVTEINGNYTTSRAFTLDPENENKRIYHNIYFYKDDFFHVLYYKKFGDLGSLYAIMSDEADQEYAEIEYTAKGSPLQINIKKQGVYNLILDVETFGIDMVKVADIDTPVYETIKSCELNIHTSNSHTYSPMTFNEETNEYYILADIPLKASIGFYNASHTGHYKMTVEDNLKERLVYWNSMNPSQVQVHVGGTYKIYFNAKTYVLRLELQNPDSASYYCQVEWKQGNELTAVSPSTPYLFEYEFVATEEYDELPSFYPHLGFAYNLTVFGDEEYVFNDECVRGIGTYKLTVNLKEFALTVEKIS